MISSRYALAVGILVAAALVPTIIHSYAGAKTNDGRVTQAISFSLAGLESEPTKRRAAWIKDIFSSLDWIERQYTGPDGASVRLFVARSFDLKRLYHHPELAILYGTDLVEGGTLRLPSKPEVPVLSLRARTGTGAAAYALLYDDRFVEDPILFQIRTSWELLFSPRRPMTLFLAYDAQLPSGVPFQESAAARVLVEAITSFLSQPTRAS